MVEFQLKKELWQAVGDRLRSNDRLEQEYALRWFASRAHQYLDSPPWSLQVAALKGLKSGDERFKTIVEA